jgi:hypothetical protein
MVQMTHPGNAALPIRLMPGDFVKARIGLAAALIVALISSAAATEKPPMSADAVAAAATPSKISAIIEFGLADIDRALERKIPRTLVSFDDRTTSCWHRRVLGRMVNIDCTYSGEVERTAPVSLRAERGKLVATTPLSGSVEAEGTRGFARMLHGDAEGAMTVFATARPQLRKDWTVALDISEGFRWQEPPTLQILGFRINLSKYVEPKIRAQLSRVQRDAAAAVAALNIRGKAEQAWQKAFTHVQIVDQPPVWLQTTPERVAFSGVRAEGRVLEGSLEIAGTAQSTIGEQPAAHAPTPLPPLGDEVSDPGRFEVIVPISIRYGAIRQQLQHATAVNAGQEGPTFSDIEIYPSAGKLVVGLLPAKSGADGGWVYLTATPKADDGSQTVQFPDLAFQDDAATAASSDIAALFGNPAFLQTLRQRLATGYQAERDRIIASANTKLTRPLGDGFRSEGQLASAGVENIALTPDTLRIDLRATGKLRLLYGL